MSTTTSAGTSFNERVQSVIAGMETTGVIDRFAANDMLLDLLAVAATDDEQGRVMAALVDLPKSTLVDRGELAGLLGRLCASQN